MSHPWGIYVHVPWCHAACPYCAFYIVPGAEAPTWDRFVAQVHAEHARRATGFGEPAHTVYVGGGTPSRLPPQGLRALLAGLPRLPTAEVTAEANPEDVCDAWLDGAVEAGVNRVSLGVQSFQPSVAGRLGRKHTSKQAEAAIRRIAAREIRSWSVDLIFAVPGQTLADLDADLDRILDLGAPHVSIYGLTVEPGTPFGRAHARGRLQETDSDTWRAMYDRIVDRLSAAGVERYEVSNFARPGHASAHNQLYWSDRPYLGLGPAAHSYAPDGARWVNPPDLEAYLVHAGADAAIEHPDPHQRATDLLVSGLRGVRGLPRDRLRQITGLDVDPRIVDAFVKQGLLRPEPDQLVLAAEGFPVADGVARRLLDTLLSAAEGASGGPVRSG